MNGQGRSGRTTSIILYIADQGNAATPRAPRAKSVSLVKLYFCFAMTLSAIFLYVAAGTIFLLRSWLLFAYGRPSIIFCEYAGPIPGKASSWSFVAELMSTNAALLAPVVAPAAFASCATAIPLIKLKAKTPTTIADITDLKLILFVMALPIPYELLCTRRPSPPLPS